LESSLIKTRKGLVDLTVIHALNLALDKQAIIHAVFNDYASPLNGPLPQSLILN
jgi:ABC-type transport system substrate-binding protein